jgi:hypothetical protein
MNEDTDEMIINFIIEFLFLTLSKRWLCIRVNIVKIQGSKRANIAFETLINGLASSSISSRFD